MARRLQPRVLLGNLDPFVQLGMARLFEHSGIDLLGGNASEGLLAAVRRLDPDCVVLDRNNTASRELAERLRLTYPEIKIILWSRDEDCVEVMDPHNAGTRTFTYEVAAHLHQELANS